MKIFTAEPYSAVSEDKLIDFKNGTYLAYFTVRWSGQVKVQVRLVHPVEILPDIKLNLQGVFGANHTFIGNFMSNASGATEERLCRYFQTLPGPVCNLGNRQSHGPWFCEKPKNVHLTCDNWKFHQMYTKPFESFVKIDAHLSALSLESLTKYYLADIKNKCAITVRDRMTSHTSVNESLGLPYCSIRGLPATVETNGHFFKGRWFPNDCRVHDFSKEDFTSCIAHKRLILLGDSTVRQMYFYFRDSFSKVFKVLPTKDKICLKQGPITLWNETLNASIYFHFHGLPIFGTGLVLRTDFVQYVADALDSMGSGSSDIIVISVWSHLLAAGKEFYINRWRAIKSAIQRYLDRNPNAKVIIKSANTRNSGSSWSNVISSIWNIHQFEGFLRELFEGEKKIGFVDAFDITKVQPFIDHVHPNIVIVKEIINRVLTYICK
ncbi:NXPE family member 3 [Holothuria leucospilota]|uniref:NXPE family member 3 n=1 Tax=Holothuria leucospilota TaxID=206669 RepID=A0A9Q1BJ46_HOLLE|nr:NXPE family member 3 [Holothuria leucospilota]